VPVRFIGEQHVVEDLGRIPSVSDWLSEMPLRPWMGVRSKLEVKVEDAIANTLEASTASQGERVAKKKTKSK
jgi:hypothetical protein